MADQILNFLAGLSIFDAEKFTAKGHACFRRCWRTHHFAISDWVLEFVKTIKKARNILANEGRYTDLPAALHQFDTTGNYMHYLSQEKHCRDSNMQQSIDDQLAQFEAGLTMGLDPDNRAPFVGNPGDDNSARRLTTLRSRWLHRRCTVCGHSFRLGDEVTLTPSGGVVHDMPRLRCAEGATTAPDDVAERQAFFQGLDAAWASSTCIERLEDGHYLLAPPQTGRARSTCRVCGHTFRPGDHVVICPCSPSFDPAQRKCIAAVHQDTLNQLHCLAEWEKARSDDTCLGMS